MIYNSANVFGVELNDQKIFDHNLYWSSDGSQTNPCGLPIGERDIIADPLFVNMDSLNLNLKDQSPAIDTRFDLGYKLDHDNNLVPMGSSPDIGAFEHM